MRPRALISNSVHTLLRSIALASIHVQLKSERSLLGMLWYILEPLGIFFILLALRNAIPTEIPLYPLYLFAGLMVFNVFAASSAHASRAIVNNRTVVHWTKVPLIIFPTAAVFEILFLHIFELLIFFSLLLWFSQPLITLLWYPLFLVPLTLFALGVSYILATLTVFSEDVSHAWRVFVTRLLWLGTPLFYTITPESFLYSLNQVNPLYHFVTLARKIFVYHEPLILSDFLVVTGVGVSTFLIGTIVFISTKQYFLERI